MGKRQIKFKDFKGSALLWKKRVRRGALNGIFANWLSFEELLNVVEIHSKKGSVRDAARKANLINMISTLETFMKCLVVRRKGKWNTTNLDKLLSNRTINLSEAYDLLGSRNKLSKEHVLIADYSFSSFNDIEEIFNSLTGKRLFDELVKYCELNQNKKWFILEKDSKWKSIIKRAYYIRNKVVHELYIQPVSKTDFQLWHTTIFLFINTLHEYFNEIDKVGDPTP
jgi:hypothetical protein